jgi:hypothetical protein
MRCIGVELAFKIDYYWAARREFFIGNGLLKFRIAFVYFGVERSSIEAFAGYGELVDECEFKISQAFNLRVASGLTESRSATTCDGDRSAKERISNNEILRGIRLHKTQVVKFTILRLPAFACQDLKPPALISLLAVARSNHRAGSIRSQRRAGSRS